MAFYDDLTANLTLLSKSRDIFTGPSQGLKIRPPLLATGLYYDMVKLTLTYIAKRDKLSFGS